VYSILFSTYAVTRLAHDLVHMALTKRDCTPTDMASMGMQYLGIQHLRALAERWLTLLSKNMIKEI